MLFTAAAEPVSACSCTNYPDFDRAVAQSNVILLGEVTAIRPAGPGYFEAVIVSMRVVGWWKGAPPNTMIDIITGQDDGICGVHFDIGSQYLVYAFNGAGLYGGPGTSPWTHSCWRTHEVYPDYPDPDIAALGPVPTRAPSWGALKISYR